MPLIYSNDYVTIRRVGGATETAPRILVGSEGSPYVGVYRYEEDMEPTEEHPEGNPDALVSWNRLTPEQQAAARANATTLCGE